MTIDQPATIEVHADADELAANVAGALLAKLDEAQREGLIPHVGLTGGTIADAIHHELGRRGPASDVDWSRVVFWWGDERFVDAGSPDRNAGAARRAFLDVVGADPANIHEIPAADQAADVSAAAATYSSMMRVHGVDAFTVLMLGVGPDGHIASLFPGFPQLDVSDQVAVAVTESPKPPPQRVTLTFPALRRSDAVWFLVSGASKADAVAAALAPDADLHQVPAAGVHGRETTWHLDRDAAARL